MAAKSQNHPKRLDQLQRIIHLQDQVIKHLKAELAILNRILEIMEAQWQVQQQSRR